MLEGPIRPVEDEIRARCDASDIDGAVAVAVTHYGDELFGFLNGLARERTQAEDAFSSTCERIWRGLAAFRWDSTFRVWAYRVARNEFLRTTREGARARKQIPISEIASVQQAIDRIHSTTPAHQRSEVKERFAQLREQLDPEDHMLLGLRIDRKMAWVDIAKVLTPTAEEPTARDLAALRKRFERLKTRLRALASEP
jgi:RNA polymerase sigma-70 factor (ECF subfamily)